MLGSQSVGASPIQRPSLNNQESLLIERRWVVSPNLLFSFLFFGSLVMKAYVCHGGVLSVRDESFTFLAEPCSEAQISGTEKKNRPLHWKRPGNQPAWAEPHKSSGYTETIAEKCISCRSWVPCMYTAMFISNWLWKFYCKPLPPRKIICKGNWIQARPHIPFLIHFLLQWLIFIFQQQRTLCNYLNVCKPPGSQLNLTGTISNLLLLPLGVSHYPDNIA